MSEQFCPYCMKILSGNETYCPACGCDVNVRAAAHHLAVGTILTSGNGHHFLFGAVKGEGGFGLTYIGREIKSGRLVAVKEYFPARCQPQRHSDASVWPEGRFEEIYRHGMQSFLSEASMLRAVGGIPSIVHVLDYFEANNTAYMVMEYLDGFTLYQMMRTRERIEPQVLIPKFVRLMYDLANLHEAGVLHRDIAPDNIMWMPDGTLKLLDFGCARSLEDGRSMTVVLKPGFAPIEQYQTKGQGPYTDIYALCATLYYCLTGKVPPASPERLTATFDSQSDPLVPPTALGAALTDEQEKVLLWGMSIQPSVRPREIAEFAARLEKASRPKEQEPANGQEKPQRTAANPDSVAGPGAGSDAIMVSHSAPEAGPANTSDSRRAVGQHSAQGSGHVRLLVGIAVIAVLVVILLLVLLFS